MAEQKPRVPKRIAAVIINSLKGGVVPRIGLPYITVGREREIQAFLTDLGLIESGGASFRFLVGRYGAGKSFLLQVGHAVAPEHAGEVKAVDHLVQRSELLPQQGSLVRTGLHLLLDR
ncbi:BREX system ATP-binding domain-containing protein, partial [Paratractidigestivibacter faecalis]|uniref:BREX system ATP-binding domain-containing protein n=1 Tax=Paratractidigestivibacter faecalis TaxID=2292441 RepID=UPI003A92160F